MKHLLCILILTCCTTLFAGTVNNIRFEGLRVTKESYLKRIISLKEGKEFDYQKLDDDVFLLRNLNLFFDVQGEAAENENGDFDIVFKIREARYLYPIFSISGFKDQLKLQLGANHINFLGKTQSFGAVYQYYDRHSFSIFHNAKRHANGRTGHELALSKYSTIEPLYFRISDIDTVSSFNFDNYSISAGGFYWLGRYLNVRTGAMYMYEDYGQRDNAFEYNGRLNFHKHQVRTSLNYNKINYLYERQEGFSGRVYGEWIHTYEVSKDNRFLKLELEAAWYKFVGKRGNFAFRTRFGLATNTFSPFAPFVLDGFLNVRGIGNRVDRGTAKVIMNAEYRQTLWNHRVFTLQGAIFSDYGSLRRPGQSFNQVFPNSEYNIFTGGGLRFHLNVWYKTSIRVDYSVNPFNPQNGGFTFGFGQFF